MFLNLYNNCQTIRIIEGIKEIAERNQDSPEGICEDGSAFPGLYGLKSISSLSDINSRNIFDSFKSIQAQLKESKTSLENIKENNLKELAKSFKEAIEENISGISPLITDKEYETLICHLLKNHIKAFFNVCNNLTSTKYTREAINDIENGKPDNGILSLYDLKRSLEVSVSENQDLIRGLLTKINPELNKSNVISIKDVNGVKTQIIFNTETKETTFGQEISEINKMEDVLKIATDLYNLLPEYDPAEDTATFIPEEKDISKEEIKKLVDLSKAEIENENLMNAQLMLEGARRNGIRSKEITEQLNVIQDKRKSPEVKGKAVVIDYKTPIPVGNKQLWIARGDDLNKISRHKKFNNNSFYLVGESLSSECIEIPKGNSVLASRLNRKFDNSTLKNPQLLLSYSGDKVKLDLSSLSFENATNERLISAHKALVGTKNKEGLIQEDIELHNTNVRMLKRLDKLEKKVNSNLAGAKLRELISHILEKENLFSNLDMHGEAEEALKEWNIKIAHKLNKKVFEICTRDGEGNGTSSTRRLLKRDDFLKAVNDADLNDFGTRLLVESILRWNIEFYKYEANNDCLFSYFDNSLHKLRSPEKTVTGAEDEINIRLQKRMEEHMWKELPNMRFKVDSFSEEKHPVVIKEKDNIKEVIISPELVYPIIRGKTSFFSTKYFEAIDTVMCYL